MTMVTASVTANSRNSRPTTSPMNSNGISTAISETVNDMMVKPICSAPLSAASIGGFARFDVARDVLDHHDGVIHHEPGGDGQRHQREVVQAVTQRIHGGEGAHQRERHGDAGNDGRVEAAQEQKDHQHHQHDRSASTQTRHPRPMPDGGREIRQGVTCMPSGKVGFELRQQTS